MHDLGQNGIIMHTNKYGITVEDVTVRNFFFQGIHYMIRADKLDGQPERVDKYEVPAIIRGCYIYNTTFAGICVDSSKYVLVEDCITFNCSFGIQCVFCENTSVTNCYTINCVNGGIHLAGNRYLPDTPQYNRIDNCHSINCPLGMTLERSVECTINNASIINSTTAGIYVFWNSHHNVITSANISDSVLAISEDDSCDYNAATALIFRNNTTDYNIHTLKIGDNPSDVMLEKKSSTVIEVKELDKTSIGGLVVDEGLIEQEYTFIDLTDLPEVGVEHDGLLTAKPIENLKPNK